MRKLHVAAAQIHAGGGMEDTLGRLARQVQAAAAVGVEVILFSECVLQGYDYDLTAESVARVAEPLHGAAADAVVALAVRHRLAILAGFVERGGTSVCDRVLVARPDGSRDVERKHALTGGELKAGLSAGQRERRRFEFGGVGCGIVICADTGIEGLVGQMKAAGIEYQFIPTGGGGKIQDFLHEADLRTPDGRRRYIENRPRVFKTEAILDKEEGQGMGWTAANAMGPVGAQTCHQGHCMIVDNRGVMRAQLPGTIVLEHLQDQMIHAELSFAG